jgi:glycosyltransferase involved in cell wall biosynthesis
VRFAIPPGNSVATQEDRAIADSYGLPARFFFLPNQFWKHKNHLLVLDALAMLRERNRTVVVAACGRQLDPRNPKHFSHVQTSIERLGLRQEFRLLGLVPYPHLAALMRASVALLNPSCLEGWSTTVEEARTLGVPLVLSDLDVHREQAGNDAIYFDRTSAAALANALDQFRPLDSSERERRMQRAALHAKSRVECFAVEFVTLAQACIARSSKACPRHEDQFDCRSP